MATKRRREVDGGLPMPFAGQRGPVGAAELDEYRARRKHHLARVPDYDAGWHRPTPATTEAVWRLLPRAVRRRLPPQLPLMVKQAALVAIDAALIAGDRGRMLTTNTVFDALARSWSDNYRAAVEVGPAAVSYDMTKTTVGAGYRDLLRHGIRLAVIWPLVRRGVTGLYRTKRAPTRGYTVSVPQSRRLAKFREVLDADSEYRRPGLHARLLLADQDVPLRRDVQDVAGGRAYNVVKVGHRSVDLMRRLEAARFHLDVPAFLRDVAELEKEEVRVRALLKGQYGVKADASNARPRGGGRSARQWSMRRVPYREVPALKALLGRYDKVRGQLLQASGVREEIRRLLAAGRITDGTVAIRSGFNKVVNRRYQPMNFWPLEVTTKDERGEVVGSFEYEDREFDRIESASRRGRWFSVDAVRTLSERDRAASRDPEYPAEWTWDRQPLVGVDVSGSQMQIIAALTGNRKVEDELRRRSFKDVAAETAWRKHADTRDLFKFPPAQLVAQFENEDDPRLREALKNAAMTFAYGSGPREIARRLQGDPSTFGPGLGDAANLTRLLTKLPGVDEVYSVLRPACEVIADRACDANPYAGVVFHDPYDKAAVRWNPWRRRMVQIARGKVKLYVRAPVGTPEPGTGDYPVWRAKLRTMLLPCLIHMLDAAFAGYVVEALHARAVTNIVSVHDAWIVAAEAWPALQAAVAAANEPWFRSLGPLYDDLIHNLKGTKFEKDVREWKATWRDRVARGDWPEFRVTDTDRLWQQDVREAV